ncbi:MAG TPA: hypothetical protein VME24_08560 [Alphaproteobacteria bacterium]|nr:hypothetical protein [Alphaproteobacteria bacterium]
MSEQQSNEDASKQCGEHQTNHIPPPNGNGVTKPQWGNIVLLLVEAGVVFWMICELLDVSIPLWRAAILFIGISLILGWIAHTFSKKVWPNKATVWVIYSLMLVCLLIAVLISRLHKSAEPKPIEMVENVSTPAQVTNPEPTLAVQVLASQLQLTSDQLAQERAKEDALNKALIMAHSAFLPRTISQEQREKFIKILSATCNISKIPIKVIVGSTDRETDNFALQFREMLDQAGYGTNATNFATSDENFKKGVGAIYAINSLPDIKVPPRTLDGINQEIVRYPSVWVAPTQSEQQSADAIAVFPTTNDTMPVLAPGEPASVMVFFPDTNGPSSPAGYTYHPTENPNSILLGVANALSCIGISAGHMAGRIPGRELLRPGEVAFFIPTKSEFINPTPTPSAPSITKPQKTVEGNFNTVYGNVTQSIHGSGNTIVGPTDNKGNTIITQSMAVGYNAHAGNGSIAIGAFAGGGSETNSAATTNSTH